jgi:hypothetical protein
VDPASEARAHLSARLPGSIRCRQAILQYQLVPDDEADVAGKRQQQSIATQDVGPLGNDGQ